MEPEGRSPAGRDASRDSKSSSIESPRQPPPPDSAGSGKSEMDDAPVEDWQPVQKKKQKQAQQKDKRFTAASASSFSGDAPPSRPRINNALPSGATSNRVIHEDLGHHSNNGAFKESLPSVPSQSSHRQTHYVSDTSFKEGSPVPASAPSSIPIAGSKEALPSAGAKKIFSPAPPPTVNAWTKRPAVASVASSSSSTTGSSGAETPSSIKSVTPTPNGPGKGAAASASIPTASVKPVATSHVPNSTAAPAAPPNTAASDVAQPSVNSVSQQQHQKQQQYPPLASTKVKGSSSSSSSQAQQAVKAVHVKPFQSANSITPSNGCNGSINATVTTAPQTSNSGGSSQPTVASVVAASTLRTVTKSEDKSKAQAFPNKENSSASKPFGGGSPGNELCSSTSTSSPLPPPPPPPPPPTNTEALTPSHQQSTSAQTAKAEAASKVANHPTSSSTSSISAVTPSASTSSASVVPDTSKVTVASTPSSSSSSVAATAAKARHDSDAAEDAVLGSSWPSLGPQGGQREPKNPTGNGSSSSVVSNAATKKPRSEWNVVVGHAPSAGPVAVPTAPSVTPQVATKPVASGGTKGGVGEAEETKAKSIQTETVIQKALENEVTVVKPAATADDPDSASDEDLGDRETRSGSPDDSVEGHAKEESPDGGSSQGATMDASKAKKDKKKKGKWKPLEIELPSHKEQTRSTRGGRGGRGGRSGGDRSQRPVEGEEEVSSPMPPNRRSQPAKSSTAFSSDSEAASSQDAGAEKGAAAASSASGTSATASVAAAATTASPPSSTSSRPEQRDRPGPAKTDSRGRGRGRGSGRGRYDMRRDDNSGYENRGYPYGSQSRNVGVVEPQPASSGAAEAGNDQEAPSSQHQSQQRRPPSRPSGPDGRGGVEARGTHYNADHDGYYHEYEYYPRPYYGPGGKSPRFYNSHDGYRVGARMRPMFPSGRGDPRGRGRGVRGRPGYHRPPIMDRGDRGPHVSSSAGVPLEAPTPLPIKAPMNVEPAPTVAPVAPSTSVVAVVPSTPSTASSVVPSGAPAVDPVGANEPGATTFYPYIYVKLPEEQIKDMVRKQIEYYFSAENLVKDTFLRRSMDAGGFISISFLAGFPRVQSMTQDVGIIVDALRESSILEVRSDGVAVRTKVNPTIWPIIQAPTERVDGEGSVGAKHDANVPAPVPLTAPTPQVAASSGSSPVQAVVVPMMPASGPLPQNSGAPSIPHHVVASPLASPPPAANQQPQVPLESAVPTPAQPQPQPHPNPITQLHIAATHAHGGVIPPGPTFVTVTSAPNVMNHPQIIQPTTPQQTIMGHHHHHHHHHPHPHPHPIAFTPGPPPPGTTVISFLSNGAQHVVNVPSSSINSPHAAHAFPHGVSPTPVAVVAPMPATPTTVPIPSQAPSSPDIGSPSGMTPVLAVGSKLNFDAPSFTPRALGAPPSKMGTVPTQNGPHSSMALK